MVRSENASRATRVNAPSVESVEGMATVPVCASYSARTAEATRLPRADYSGSCPKMAMLELWPGVTFFSG